MCISHIVKENPELDLNVRDNEGNTPLHLAAKNNKDEGRDSVLEHVSMRILAVKWDW